MKRRSFLKMTAPAAAAPMLLNGLPLQSFANAKLFNDCQQVEDRVLVIVQMRGGNDGLNTLVPINQYDAYAALRPNLKIKNSGNNAFMNLDSTLSLENQIGLHPSMSSLKDLYDSGYVNIVQNVTYPNSNKSHFKSTDLMLSGGDGRTEYNNLKTGWFARFLESTYDRESMQDPLGIQLGSKKPSFGFHSDHQHAPSINLTGQDPAGYYTLVNEIGGEGPGSILDSDYGRNLQHIMSVESEVNTYAERISEVFNNGSNEINYPETDLAQQFKTVARMVAGGSKTKVFLTTLAGFDTHNDQIVGGSSHLGVHANLLKEFSDAVKAFQDDLEAIGIADKVMTVTFSEFGRKFQENGNLGTDHGTITPSFVIGKCVKGGVTGGNIRLGSSRIGSGAYTQHDYRQLYTTMIQDWMGGSNNILESTFSESYQYAKLDLIKNGHSVLPDCYIQGEPVTTGFFNNEVQDEMLSIFPNPATNNINLELRPQTSGNVSVNIINIAGQVVKRKQAVLHSGYNIINAEVSELPSATYFVQIVKDSQLFARGQFIKL